jgi:hypothetical protein
MFPHCRLTHGSRRARRLHLINTPYPCSDVLEYYGRSPITVTFTRGGLRKREVLGKRVFRMADAVSRGAPAPSPAPAGAQPPAAPLPLSPAPAAPAPSSGLFLGAYASPPHGRGDSWGSDSKTGEATLRVVLVARWRPVGVLMRAFSMRCTTLLPPAPPRQALYLVSLVSRVCRGWWVPVGGAGVQGRAGRCAAAGEPRRHPRAAPSPAPFPRRGRGPGHGWPGPLLPLGNARAQAGPPSHRPHTLARQQLQRALDQRVPRKAGGPHGSRRQQR